MLVGSGKFFPPAQPLATTMLTRPSPDENPRATAPSILYIRNSIPPVPTPIDVVVGDEASSVGVKMVCSMITVTTAGISVELAPLKKSTIGLKKNTGVKSNTGAKQETGVQSQAGAEVRASAKAMAILCQYRVELKHPLFQVKYLLVEHLEINLLIFLILLKPAKE